jgi:hypothetical protein
MLSLQEQESKYSELAFDEGFTLSYYNRYLVQGNKVKNILRTINFYF